MGRENARHRRDRITFEEWWIKQNLWHCYKDAARQAWDAAQQAEREKRKPLSDDEIRSIMLANGFTIKDGCEDLKPYVYAAVRAIEQKIWGNSE